MYNVFTIYITYVNDTKYVKLRLIASSTKVNLTEIDYFYALRLKGERDKTSV